MPNKPSKNLKAGTTETEFNGILTPKTPSDIETAVNTINTDGGGYILQLPRAPKNSNELDVTGLNLPLDIDVDDVWVRGHGEESTVLSGGTTTVFRANNTNYQNLVFSDFRLEVGDVIAIDLVRWHGTTERVTVQGAGKATSTQPGIRCTACNASVIRDCSVISSNPGILHRDNANGNFSRARVVGCELTSNARGMVWNWTGSTGQPHTVLSAGNLMEKNDNEGFFVKGVANVVIWNDRYSRNDQVDNGNIPDVLFTAGAGGNNKGGLIAASEFDANSGASTNVTDFGVELKNIDSVGGTGVVVGTNHFRAQGTDAIRLRASAVDTYIRPQHYDAVTDTLLDNGTRTRINGIGSESANAETPTAANWNIGDVVDFIDTGDGSGDGVYKFLPDETWSQIGST